MTDKNQQLPTITWVHINVESSDFGVWGLTSLGVRAKLACMLWSHLETILREALIDPARTRCIRTCLNNSVLNTTVNHFSKNHDFPSPGILFIKSHTHNGDPLRAQPSTNQGFETKKKNNVSLEHMRAHACTVTSHVFDSGLISSKPNTHTRTQTLHITATTAFHARAQFRMCCFCCDHVPLSSIVYLSVSRKFDLKTAFMIIRERLPLRK